jgi:hypothetical protein
VALGVFVSIAGAACVLNSDGFLASGGSGPGSSSASSGGGGGMGGGAGGGAGGEASTSSSGGGGGAGAEGGGGPVSPYLYRRPIAIKAGAAAVPPDYSIAIQLDHSSLVMNKKSRQNGNDVRVYRTNGNEFEELNRVLDPTSTWNSGATILWFRLRSEIPASTTDSSYSIFYGDLDAPMPPDDGEQVYLVWDDFTSPSLSPEWTFEPIGNATGTVSQTNGVVAIEASTGDIWFQQDSFVFLHRPITGNFVADSRVTAVGGASDKWGKLGGVMIRENTTAGSRHRHMSPVYTSAARINAYRLKDGTNTAAQANGNGLKIPEIDRVTRIGDFSSAYFSSDGELYQKLGNDVTFTTPLSQTVRVGIPVCNNHANKVTVSVDWFRVRRLVSPEPTAVLLAEEPGEL